MIKNTIIQIRITKSDKEKLKNVCYYMNSNISQVLTSYLDNIIKDGYVSLYRNEDYTIKNNRVLSNEELKEIVGGASTAINNEDFDLARKILMSLNDFKIVIENRNQFINIRYDKNKKDIIENIAKKNNLTISSLLDNYIKSLLYKLPTIESILNPTKIEFAEEMKKSNDDINNGDVYTLEECDKEMKTIFGEEFVENLYSEKN